MSYPTLEARAADAVADGILAKMAEEELAKLSSTSDGADYPKEFVEAASERAREQWSDEERARSERGEPVGPYYLEAFMASRLHSDLGNLPIDLLQDFGFWRYLALFPYRWYLQEREGDDKGHVKPQDYGGTSPKTDQPERRVNASPAYQLLLRTFLWGKIAFDANERDPYRRATLVNETGGAVTDIWHSHLIRIQLGQLGRMPHAFLDSICSDPRANGTDPGRVVEKRLTRMKHTVLYDVYDLNGARALVDGQKALALKTPPGEADHVQEPT